MILIESAQQAKKRRVLGIWDLSVVPISLGGMLILAEELKIQCIINGVESADICIIGDAKRLTVSCGSQDDEDKVILLDSKQCKDSPVLSALMDMQGIGACYFSSTMENLQNFLSSNSYCTWPLLTKEGLIEYKYDSTMFAQKFYRENGFIPHLSCNLELLRWAMNFVRSYVLPRMPVVVHLKNNPNQQGYSNADFDAWLSFFNACDQRYDITFILIGNEEIDKRIRNLPNILVSREFGSNLLSDLALIQIAFIFMGMASGPCNIALFSDIPYIIYKNPNHHTEEMKLELGGSDRFSFATPLQKIIRVFESSEGLLSEFTHLYTHITEQDWQRRLAKLINRTEEDKDN